LEYCNRKKLAVCPQGGNTGLVGGSVPVHDEVVVNLKKMNNIIQFDSGVVVSQAGVILQNLEAYVNELGYTIPLDLGAKGSCQIGGNASTNAGGIRLLRYGSLHGNILGFEAVLANGTILENLNILRKDNTGYDLKQLFIGSEGTLGIVTSLSILCYPKPKSVNLCLLGTSSFEKVNQILKVCYDNLGEILSAYEFFDFPCLDTVMKNYSYPNPLSNNSQFYIVIETFGSNENHDKEKLDNLIKILMENNLIDDGTIAQDKTKITSLWRYREEIPTAITRSGYCYKYDISLPREKMYEIVEIFRERFKDEKDVGIFGYGHIGDGNLHLNILAPDKSENVYNKIYPFIYEYVKQVKGSISAEHGLGLMKPNEIYYSKSRECVKAMVDIKKTV